LRFLQYYHNLNSRRLFELIDSRVEEKMEKNDIIRTLELAKSNSPTRKFKQSIDLIITLKDLDQKKVEGQIELFVQLRYGRGKPVKICGLVGPELLEQSKEAFDMTIESDEFIRYEKDKKLVKKLAKTYDFFVAQGNIMNRVAASFGRVLGPRGKMPNPKSGCVVPANANLKVLKEKLQKTIRLNAKTRPYIQCRIGLDDSKQEEITDNFLTIYNQLISVLPSHENNIGAVMLKLTMGKAIKVKEKSGEKVEAKKIAKPKAVATA
jgi:large subunit ribosomal protein L1